MVMRLLIRTVFLLLWEFL